MEPVEFRDMEYVMAVHEEQSFSGAARKHFISQPVLSRVVRKVERNLGVTLFDRSSIPLKPTPQGQKVLEYFEQMQKLRRAWSDGGGSVVFLYLRAAAGDRCL